MMVIFSELLFEVFWLLNTLYCNFQMLNILFSCLLGTKVPSARCCWAGTPEGLIRPRAETQENWRGFVPSVCLSVCLFWYRSRHVTWQTDGTNPLQFSWVSALTWSQKWQ